MGAAVVPDGYKSPRGRGMAEQKGDQGIMDAGVILEEIRNLKKELVDDMRDLGTKIDGIASNHNDLRLEFTKVTTQQETRLVKLEKDITALWDHNRTMRSDISACQTEITTHKEVEATKIVTKQETAEWVRWVPGTIFGLIALGLSLWPRG